MKGHRNSFPREGRVVVETFHSKTTNVLDLIEPEKINENFV